MVTEQDAEFYKWKGTIDRTPSYFSTTGDLKLHGVPEELWERLAGVCEPVKKALEEREEKLAKANPSREEIELPGNDILISDFARKLVGRFRDEHVLFYRQDSRQVVELGSLEDSEGKIIQNGFITIKPSRFITLIEKYFWPWTTIFKKSGGSFQVKKSMNKDVGSVVLDSEIFQNGLPNISRIFTVQIPIIHEGQLTFPKEGYDSRFNSWLPYNSPRIENMDMSVEDAKKIIYDIFNEFCFETRQDYVNAISALITPFLRGLFITGFNTRTPVYCYEANRERSGKDYLAGVTGVLYEGHALEEPPISNGEYRSSGGNDELRKKLIAAMISGRKRLHFSNNKGHLNNSVLESVTTAEKYSDRLLGKNEIVTIDNELDFSFSGNIGITLTPDLTNRTLFIRLFLDIEDANKRIFERPNLHGWVLHNRNKILSALYALVRNWFEKECPNGKVPFSSFPEWARVCGGIMECASYDNPCHRGVQELGVSVDTDTDEMKELFELCYASNPDVPMDKICIKNIIIDSNLLSYIQWGERSAQTKFGIKLNKFVGRILSDIRLEVTNKSSRPSRWQYKFTKKFGNTDKNDIFSGAMVTYGNLGNLVPIQQTTTSSKNIGVLSTLPTLPQVTTDEKDEVKNGV